MAKVLILNGPNLNLLGSREPDHYGTVTLDVINERLGSLIREVGGQLMAFQSNAEHELVDKVHAAPHENIDFIISTPLPSPTPASPCAMPCWR